VWSYSHVQNVHTALEEEMKTVLHFRVIGETNNDTWVDGVEIEDPKKLIIYLV
jgi:hypothetical protein